MPRYLYLLIAAIIVTSCDQVLSARTAVPPSPEAVQYPELVMEDLVLAPGDFLASNASGMALLPEGLTTDSLSPEAVYLSEPQKAPIIFNALVPQWQIDHLENSEKLLELRTGSDPANLGQWVPIHTSLDWTLPDDEDVVGEMLAVPAHDARHEYFQYRLTLKRDEALSGPLLRELRFTFIDSTAGPTVEEMIERQTELDRSNPQTPNLTAEEPDGYPKPFFISRDVWCTNPACDYSEGLTYQPVTHLILHHTVSSTGADGDSAAVVRAIWAFHTSGRGWQDIGYNYLVDTEGLIYEGHLGGDDVVGIHASGANAGTMALAMIGTYSTKEPPGPMFESAVDLFSWKADQKDIDVFDASDTLPNIDWGLPHLMGHRDVYGTTECPGGAAHALIPNIRDEVAARIGLESSHIYIDELSSSFHKSNATWYDGPLQCGHNAHSWYTWSTTDPAESANEAQWQPLIPESGRYRIEVYAPYCNTGEPETTGAHYTVEHAGGSSNVVVNQDDRIGLWTSLGEYTLNAGRESTISLEDLTQTDDGRGVWFDSIRLLPLELLPLAKTESPADGSWLNEREIAFTWQIENPDKAKATVLQVATDDAFQNRIVNEISPTPVLSATVELEQDYADLFWRVVVTSESNNEYPSAVSQFGLDSEPPVSKVSKLYWFKQAGYYELFWQGADALSGVEKYNIDYRLVGDQTWQSWLSDTTKTSASFSPPDPIAVYEFRTQAVDKLGNAEPLHSSADISTDEAVVFAYSVLLPMVNSN